MRLFAVASPGLDQLVRAELGALGVNGEAVPGGTAWEGNMADLRLANLHLRCATRVLARLAEFRARTFFELERHARRVPWETVLGADRLVALRVTSKKSKLYHEGAIEERLKAAIVARSEASFVAHVDEEEGSGDVQLLVVRVLRDQFTVSADSSGEALHRRGYRQAVGRAPLRESIAAALLHLAGWRGQTPLLDPFCGSGTIPIEAALLARGIAPGIARAGRAPRAFAFTSWPEHDPAAWRAQVDGARAAVRERAGVAIVGSDRDAGAIQLARGNAERAGVEGDVLWQRAPLSAAVPPSADAALVSNPPYGVRVSAGADLRNLWASLGAFVRERMPQGPVALLSPDVALERQLALALTVAAAVRHGGIPVRVLVRNSAAALLAPAQGNRAAPVAGAVPSGDMPRQDVASGEDNDTGR